MAANGGVTARELKDLILGAVEAFQGGAPQWDDQTLVVVRILPAAPD